jgi:WD40 repeat protein
MSHARRLLLSSNGVRQFEFHPSRPGVLLAGRKDGVISVLNYEADVQTNVLEVDHVPILGLSWLHTQPQRAVVGASLSGTICVVGYDDNRPGDMDHLRLEPFPHLSSLSVNCTDDFFMTSGFCIDLALYDMGTGRRLSTFCGLHQNFINILRFGHRSPHLFATASFDQTCKVWDLREPINAERPMRLLKTETLNVMCCFSPDDQNILCSGVDSALQQFSLAMPASKEETVQGTRFPLPALHSETNYRRSLYLADGNLVATAATSESLLRVYKAQPPHLHQGHIDFRNMLSRRRQRYAPGVGGVGGQQRSADGRGVVHTWGASQADTASTGSVSQPRTMPAQVGPGEEYVQSLRCHPTDPALLGALLSTCDDPMPESYIAMLRLG